MVLIMSKLDLFFKVRLSPVLIYSTSRSLAFRGCFVFGLCYHFLTSINFCGASYCHIRQFTKGMFGLDKDQYKNSAIQVSRRE